MSEFTDFLKSDGDRICTFVSSTSIALMGLKAVAQIGPSLPPSVLLGLLILSTVASQAHQAFFPSAQTLLKQQRASFFQQPRTGASP